MLALLGCGMDAVWFRIPPVHEPEGTGGVRRDPEGPEDNAHEKCLRYPAQSNMFVICGSGGSAEGFSSGCGGDRIANRKPRRVAETFGG